MSPQPLLAPRRLSDAAKADPGNSRKSFSAFSLGASTFARRHIIRPQAEATEKSVSIFARPPPRRQAVKFLDVAASDHRVIGSQRRPETFDDVGHMTSPFLLAVALQAVAADIIFVGPFLVRQMADLHRLQQTLYDQRGAQGHSPP